MEGNATLRPESAKIDGESVNINDYLIDQAGFDWQAMLAGWAEILPQTFTMWLVNRFG